MPQILTKGTRRKKGERRQLDVGSTATGVWLDKLLEQDKDSASASGVSHTYKGPVMPAPWSV